MHVVEIFTETRSRDRDIGRRARGCRELGRGEVSLGNHHLPAVQAEVLDPGRLLTVTIPEVISDGVVALHFMLLNMFSNHVLVSLFLMTEYKVQCSTVPQATTLSQVPWWR